ncbi:hypothetical protein Bbelb_411660 [Branchiostoma belcheri]|nr:hypothetical protein Bbelb_411660 [Branchiostoma belcheri]
MRASFVTGIIDKGGWGISSDRRGSAFQSIGPQEEQLTGTNRAAVSDGFPIMGGRLGPWDPIDSGRQTDCLQQVRPVGNTPGVVGRCDEWTHWQPGFCSLQYLGGNLCKECTVLRTKDRDSVLIVESVQHQGQRKCWTGTVLFVWKVFSTEDREIDVCSAPGTGTVLLVWKVFSTRDRDNVVSVESVQHQGQRQCCLCGKCSAPGTGTVLFVWKVFSTRDSVVCVESVQHR